MSQSAETKTCTSKGCGHPMSAHVHDRIMEKGEWLDVKRCLDCEHAGGPCTDGHAILEEVD